MKLWNSLSTTFLSAFRHPWLWLVQFLGNIVLIVIAALWFQIGVEHWWNLLFQLFIALFVILGVLSLHSGTLNYFSGLPDNRKIKPAFKNAFKHLPAFALWAAIFCTLLYFLDKLDNYQYQFPGFLRSEFPAWLRRLVSESAMDNFYAGFVGFLRWVVLPGLLLPFGLLAATIGFRGLIMFHSWWRAIRNLAYWIVLIVAAMIGVYCTGKIISQWRLDPKTSTLGGEEVFVVFRFLFAYLLALFSWFWVCGMLARARPQPDPPAASQKAAA